MKYFFIILFILLTLNSFAQNKAPNAAGVYEQPEIAAYFQAGKDSLDRFIMHNIRLQNTARGHGVNSNAIVVFIVEKDGSVGAAEILRTSGDKEFDSESVRIAKSMPKWVPARDKGEVVRSSNMLTFSYRLN